MIHQLLVLLGRLKELIIHTQERFGNRTIGQFQIIKAAQQTTTITFKSVKILITGFNIPAATKLTPIFAASCNSNKETNDEQVNT